jgi:hypothetical protein
MTVIVKHNKTNSITDWTQAQLDEQIALGNFPSGTTLANIVLPSDWNNDHTLTGLGTMAEQDATAVAITGGTINNTTIGATTATTGKFTTLEVVNAGANAGLTLLRNTDTASNSTRLFMDSSSGVNAIYNSAGFILFNTSATIGTSTGSNQFRVAPTGSAVNYVQATGAATTKEPIISVAGSDSDISMALQSKGTGAIDLAAGSSGVNISNGNTVTATTVTTSGVTAYTSHPTPAITAPTTAGGVQATATSNLFYNSALATTSIVNGGTGYTVGNTLIVVGGTSTATAQFTVTAVSSGVVTAINSTSGGTYSVIPTGTLSVTGGSGTGFTFTINGWAVRSLNITNAGSGYIEQPTITFSGGGGSGAAAYATVGSGTTIQTLGSSLTLQTPSLNTNNTFLQVKDDLTNPTSQTAFYVVGASSGLGRLALRSSKSLYVSSGSSNSISFTTGSSATVDGSTQFTVANTTSAVNRVEVTGSATGSASVGPTISTQGSSADAALILQKKGNGEIVLQGTSRFGANQVNYISAAGAVASSAPVLSVAGTDTDIDLTLTPKGTGNVRFGTYTAGVLTPTGYVTIKDSGGTTRRLLVG